MSTAVSTVGALTVEERFDRLSAQVEAIGADLTRQREARERWAGMTELGADVSSLSGAGVARVTDLLAEAERKGYFTVARGGATVADHVVAAYADEDFEALGESLALLLGVAKKLADPELIGLLDRAVDTLAESQPTHLDPPSTLGLLRSLREPQTRRGLARVLALLQTIGAESTSPTSAQPNRKG